jgi:hypothetical protein
MNRANSNIYSFRRPKFNMHIPKRFKQSRCRRDSSIFTSIVSIQWLTAEACRLAMRVWTPDPGCARMQRELSAGEKRIPI